MPSNTKHSSHPVAAISTVVGKRRCITKKDSTATTSLAIMTIVAVAMTIMDQVMLENMGRVALGFLVSFVFGILM